MRSSSAYFVASAAALSLLLTAGALAEGGAAGAADVESSQAPRSVDALLSRLARVPSLRAHFREEKRIQLLRQPLVSEGTLVFARPSWVLRLTESPEPAALLLREGTLTLQDPGGQRVVQLDASPLLRGFVECFAYVLAGERAALERHYGIDFEARADSWELRLTPRDPRLLRMVKRLSFVGQGAHVARMELLEASGDVTRMEFTQVEHGPALSPAEKQRVFSLPAR
jgi:outer membrane lipoprotein-sorting protein